jgi:hypothetical protein
MNSSMIWWLTVFWATWAPLTRPFLVQVDFDLGQRQLDRSAVQPPLAQDHGQFVHAAQQGEHAAAQLGFPAVRIGQVIVDFFVGESPLAGDRRVVELRRHARSVSRQLDEHALGVPQLVRLQAGQAVGDQLRQHGNHAVRQVDAGRPLASLDVQQRTRRDEMRHVGDMDSQSPVAVFEAFQRDRVVEIAGILRIDRDDRLASQIQSLADRLVERRRLSPRVVHDVQRKMLGQIELADDRARIDARRAAGAQHLDDHALAGMEVRRKPQHLDHHLVALGRVLRAGVGHGDRFGEDAPVDLDARLAGALLEDADELVRFSLDHFNHGAARALLAGPRAFQADFDHVTAGRVARLAQRDEDVLVSALRRRGSRRPDEPVAFRRAVEFAGNQRPVAANRLGARQRDQMLRSPGQFAGLDQLLDGFPQIAVRLRGQIQLFSEYPRLDGLIVRGADMRQDALFERFFGHYGSFAASPPLKSFRPSWA